jgi:hypothetical protein
MQGILRSGNADLEILRRILERAMGDAQDVVMEFMALAQEQESDGECSDNVVQDPVEKAAELLDEIVSNLGNGHQMDIGKLRNAFQKTTRMAKYDGFVRDFRKYCADFEKESPQDWASEATNPSERMSFRRKRPICLPPSKRSTPDNQTTLGRPRLDFNRRGSIALADTKRIINSDSSKLCSALNRRMSLGLITIDNPLVRA